MQSITVKNIPDNVHKSLKEIAKIHRRSLNNEIICCLEKHVGCSMIEPLQIIEKAKQNRSRIKHRFSRSDIAEAINEGRK